MTQHEPKPQGRVVHRYDATDLGAPFKVTLVDSVIVREDSTTGETLVRIPDLVGLINEIVRSRVCHARKLDHRELKFIRKSLGVKAYKLADFLGMSAEHFSRCEAGTKAMSSASEKLLRCFAFIATRYHDAEALLDGTDGGYSSTPLQKSAGTEDGNGETEFTKFFFSMKIEIVFEARETLSFEFQRSCPVGHGMEPEDGLDGKWNDAHKQAA